MSRTVVTNVPQSQRVMRRPKHNFQLRTRPWQIQPFMIAPVLPGETLKNANFQARMVTKPIKNPLIGWWAEYYWFYCKHRDLDGSADFQAMVLEQGHDMSATRAGSDSEKYYRQTGDINYVTQCLKRVVETYFRADDDGAWDSFAFDGLPIAQVNTWPGWMDSLTMSDALPLGGEDPGDATTIDELNTMMENWQFMVANGLTSMTYEDFLRTYGVRGQAAEAPNTPELLRYVRDWTYPTNTVEPTTGAPSSACVWSLAERIDKDRYFTEPGFIFGVQVVRPKVYFSKQNSAMAGYLDTAFNWLPAVMADDVYTSLKRFSDTEGPLQDIVTDTDGYWLDVRDLFLYGDQFINFALTETNAGFVALPTATCEYRYASLADANGLFVAANDDAGLRLIHSEGVVTLNILGRQKDNT